MKLRIGNRQLRDGQVVETTTGTIEDTPQGLRYSGNVASLKRLVAGIAGGERPEDAPGGLPGFMAFVQRQTNNSGMWCEVVPSHSDDGSSSDSGGAGDETA